jgi:high-affinity iron transporter
LKATFNIRRRLPLIALIGAILAAALFAFRGRAPASPASTVAADDTQHLVAILQYLESDYPAAVASGDAGELAEQRSLSAEALAATTRVPEVFRFGARVASIDARVRQGDDAAGVSADCASLVEDVIAATGIMRAPSAPPDLTEGARLFAQSCASCHGATGQGDGTAAAVLKPKPANFHSDEVMADLTPFKAFNVVRFGVKGTAMAPFTNLDEPQRWALAFYVFTLRQPACDHAPPGASLDALANGSDAKLAGAFGAGEVACLRARLPQLDGPAMLAAARARLEQARRLSSSGDSRGAESAVLDAYLSDIEPIEPWLRARDAESVSQLEASFTTARAALQQGDGAAQEPLSRLVVLLDRAAGARPAATAVSAFWFSALVIVREGFEAAVIIAALLAVVKKRKQVARARFVHAGWLSALGVGAVIFVVARKLVSGAMNEKMEGFLAIVAAAMLLHAALWLNARSTTRRSMGELRDRATGALDRGALALFGIAFLAMFRETLETAVFLEALSIDAPRAVVWGALSGGATLLGLVYAVNRVGLRLPMTKLFRISTVVLVATAVMLVGQGVHSFEEVGILPSRPLPIPAIDALGIYGDQLGLILQLAVVAAALAIWRLGVQPVKTVGLERAPDPGE